MRTLDLDEQVALVEPCEPGYTTTAKDVSQPVRYEIEPSPMAYLA